MNIQSFKVSSSYDLAALLENNEGAYEIDMTINNAGASKIMLSLLNNKGEKVDMYYDVMRKQFVMDRSESGKVDFSVDFPAVTVAPVSDTDAIHLRLFVDRTSIEAFGEDGKFVMTNQVFPSEAYNRMLFTSVGGKFTVKSMTVYKLGK